MSTAIETTFLTRAIDHLIEDATAKHELYTSRLSGKVIPQGDDAELFSLAAYYSGVIGGLQDLKFHLAVYGEDIGGGY